MSWSTASASKLSVIAALFLAGLAPNVYAQSFQGGLRGEVRDAAAVIPGVTVTLINESTTVARTTVSNQVGAYVFAAVAPGTYTVRASLAGFKTFERKGLAIGTQQFVTMDLVMEVGAIEESVSVTGEAPLIETSNASTGQVLTKETIDALPALNRNVYMSSAVTVPTVVASGDPYFSRMEDQTNGSLVSLGGGPRRANNYLLDGVSTTDLQNRTSVFVGSEAISEVKIQVHTYDAEMGRSGGGVFNTTGRSGSNTVHGSVFGQTRPYSLAAADFFAARAGREKLDGPYYRYWGGSIGGPIARNRTFFWFAHEGYRTNSSATTLLNFPTDRERSGDFSQTFDRSGALVVIYDPLTTRPNASGAGFTRTPFPGNVIPPNRISTVAKNIAAVMPQPTEQRSGASDGVPNFSSTVQVPTEAEQYFWKGEHRLSDKMSLTGLYLYQNTDELQAHTWGEVNLFAGPGVGAEVRRVHVVALNHLTVPNSTTTVALRFGWTMFRDGVFGTPYDAAQLGFPASFLNDVQFQRFPNGSITGYSGFGNRTENSAIYQSWVVNGSITKLLGRNTIRYGGDFRRIGGESRTLGASGGNFSFGREWTQQDPFVARATEGNGFATFLLGYPTTGSVAVTTPVDAYIDYSAAYHSGRSARQLEADTQLRPSLRIRDRAQGGGKSIHCRFRSRGGQPACREDRPASRWRLPLCRPGRISGPSRGSVEEEVLSARGNCVEPERQDRRSRWLWIVLVAVGVHRIRNDQLGADRLYPDYVYRYVQCADSNQHAGQSVSEWTVDPCRKQSGPVDRCRRKRNVRRSRPPVTVRAADIGGYPAAAAGKHGRHIRVCRRQRRQSELRRRRQHQSAAAGAARAWRGALAAGGESVPGHPRGRRVCHGLDNRTRPVAAAVSTVSQRAEQPGQRRAIALSCADSSVRAARGTRGGRAVQLHVEPAARQHVRRIDVL